MFIRDILQKGRFLLSLIFPLNLYLLHSSQVSNNKKKYLLFLFHRFFAICIHRGTLDTLSSMI